MAAADDQPPESSYPPGAALADGVDRSVFSGMPPWMTRIARGCRRRPVGTPVPIAGGNDATAALRPATPADRAALRTIFQSSRIGALDLSALPDDMRKALSEMQFGAQERQWRSAWPHGRFELIEWVGDGAAPPAIMVGRLYSALTPNALHLIDITLLPAFRGGGLGGALIALLQTDAARRGLPLTLNVAQGNPAERLYRRLDFVDHPDGHPPGNGEAVYRPLIWRPRGHR